MDPTVDPAAQIDALNESLQSASTVVIIFVVVLFCWNVAKTIYGWWQAAAERKAAAAEATSNKQQPVADSSNGRVWRAQVAGSMQKTEAGVAELQSSNGALVAHIEALTKAVEDLGDGWRDSAKEHTSALLNINTSLVTLSGQVRRLEDDAREAREARVKG